MMRIRITKAMPEGAVLNGAPWPAEGEETEVPTAQAAHLIASGVAEDVVLLEEAVSGEEPPAARRGTRPVKEASDG